MSGLKIGPDSKRVQQENLNLRPLTERLFKALDQHGLYPLYVPPVFVALGCTACVRALAPKPAARHSGYPCIWGPVSISKSTCADKDFFEKKVCRQVRKQVIKKKNVSALGKKGKNLTAHSNKRKLLHGAIKKSETNLTAHSNTRKILDGALKKVGKNFTAHSKNEKYLSAQSTNMKKIVGVLRSKEKKRLSAHSNRRCPRK